MLNVIVLGCQALEEHGHQVWLCELRVKISVEIVEYDTGRHVQTLYELKILLLLRLSTILEVHKINQGVILRKLLEILRSL